MSLLFVFALGMGTLLIIVGTFTGVIAALPKSGTWMLKIKFISGMILIGAAEYFLYITGTLSI
jgi:thiol:disulfide interchange protein DsbD